MDHPTRRGVIAAMGLAATAGCSQLRGAVPGSQSSEILGEQVAKTTKTVALKKDQFEPFHVSFDQQTVLMFSVVADAKIDVITFARPHFRKYKDGSADQLPFIGEFTELDTRATAKGSDVTPGEPVVVVDNTSWGESAPKQDVTVEVELEAYVRPSGQGGNGSG